MTTKRVATSIDALHAELNERMRGVPVGYSDGVRTVPVTYHVEATPLVDAEEFIHRDHVAELAYGRLAKTPRGERERESCFNRLTNAMRSDDGIGTSFMTPAERTAGSYEWGKRLRELLDAGKRRDKERERGRVLVDIQDED